MVHQNDSSVPEGVVIIENAIEMSIEDENIQWDDPEDSDLPDGMQVKYLNHDEEFEIADKIIKFPPGYVEPAHSHKSVHSVIVLDGGMLVHGHELTAGDYIFGPAGKLHGPMEYPEGCILFSSSVGGASLSDWTEAE